MNPTSGIGLPLHWFDSDQQRHITAHCMDNIPTITVLAHQSSHQNTVLGTHASFMERTLKRCPTCGLARPNAMMGGHLAGSLRSGLIKRCGNRLCRCATSCGSRL